MESCHKREPLIELLSIPPVYFCGDRLMIKIFSLTAAVLASALSISAVAKADTPIFGAAYDSSKTAGIAGGNASPTNAGTSFINDANSRFGAGSLNTADVFPGGEGIRYSTVDNFNPLAGTVDFWMQMPNGYNGVRQDLFSIFAGGYTGDFSLYINPGTLRLHTVVDVNGNNQWQQGGYENAYATLGDGDWHHIAWEWDTVAGFATLYVDGVAENYNALGTVSFAGGTLGAEMEIGSRQGGYDAFQGNIDDFRIFDTAIYGQSSFTPPTQSTIPDSPVGVAGDFDDDGDVDGRDFLAWQRGESPTPYSAGDLTAWTDAYDGSPIAAVNAIPEPSTAWLLALLGSALVSTRARLI